MGVFPRGNCRTPKLKPIFSGIHLNGVSQIMKHFLISFVLVSVLLSAGAFAGPSAKFAATYDNERGFKVVSVIEATDATNVPFDCNENQGYTLATIKVPQDKELLVGLSAEVLLVTDTSIKGKEGGSARALAYSGGFVTLTACPVDGGVCQMAEPGTVILADRFQIMSATLGGVLESCTDVDGSGGIEVPDECEFSDEEIGLVLDTLTSHHFNFVLPNMDQGEYDVKAMFSTEACHEITSDGDATASTYAAAAIGKYMLTLQQVRAAKGGIINMDIIEP